MRGAKVRNDGTNAPAGCCLLQAANGSDENGVAEVVRVTVEGREARVLYAGAQGQFVGLDQLNVELPPSLEAGARRAEVKVYLNGVEADRVTVQLK